MCLYYGLTSYLGLFSFCHSLRNDGLLSFGLNILYNTIPVAIGTNATQAIPATIPPPTTAPIAASPDVTPAADKPTTRPDANI